MSHLKLVVDYRTWLNDNGITCSNNQTKATQEAFIRALIMYNAKLEDSFCFNENTEELIYEQMDRWNAVFPLNARFIFESAKSRLGEIRKQLSIRGNLNIDVIYEVVFDVETVNAEGQAVPSKFNATECEQFVELTTYLYKELVAGNE